MKALITGANGFVGHYLAQELSGHGWEVFGTDLSGEGMERADLLDPSSLLTLLKRILPDAVFHLAGQASVSLSWKNPALTISINVEGTVHVLEAVHAVCPKARVLIVGSSDAYGMVRPEDCPVKETLPLSPQSPYAVSKTAQEQMVQALARAYSMDVVLTRSFNHFGPGQHPGFVISDFAQAIARIEAGRADPVLQVGNLEAERDFTDVRDVVRAYRLLAEIGRRGEVYNVGSGRAYRISEVLRRLLSMAQKRITVREDPEKLRPADVPVIVCCADKLRQDTGWAPVYPIEKTLRDTLDDWRCRSV